MYINFKVLSVFVSAFLLGCTGNSGSSKIDVNSDIKRFSGVVNNSSVKGINVGAIRIGKHGQFAINENNQVNAITNTSDDNGRFGFSVENRYIGPYVLSAVSPEYENESDAAQSSCQLVAGCQVKEGENPVSFGEYFLLDSNKQWSAAVEFVSNGQFIVINPITEMAKALGYTTYINDGTNISGSLESDLGTTTKPSANYYSNHGILKGNTQTASLVGLSDILSIEPANLTLLHTLNASSSSEIKASIRYGALLAAWQQLELEHEEEVDGDPTFQQMVIKEYLANQGQLYQSLDNDLDTFTLKKWYQAARQNLVGVRTYYNGLGRSIPAEVNSVISDFEDEISGFKEGVTTDARPSINQQYEDDYNDAVAKTKAMVNYLSNLHANFATEEFRTSVKSSSDLITAETRRFAPKLDIIFKKLLSIQQYYLSCTHNNCDVQSEWHGEGSIYNENTRTLKISSSLNSVLEVSQELFFDEINPVGSTESNVHDLVLSGSFEYEGLILELSDYGLDDDSSIKSSIRFSFPKALAQLPLPPAEIEGGMGMTVDEDLVPDYIEMVLPDFKLYDLNNVGGGKEFKISGSLTALMFANTDAADLLKDDKEKLGKRYNLSSVKGTLKLTGGKQSGVGGTEEFRDNALVFLDASASESVVSSNDPVVYFPDRKYPTFESFFKPRAGFEVGSVSPSPLVVSRKGEMKFPLLNSDGGASETELVEVTYLELDYEIGGLERYIVYPKLDGEDVYWGLICTAQPGDEDDLIAAGDGYTKTEQDSEGKEYQRSLLSCPFRDKYAGEATVDDFANQVYKLNKDLFNLREYNGHGAYRINYPLTSNEELSPFDYNKVSHTGTLEKSIVLGVDQLRLQFKPNLVNSAVSDYLPDSILDISLVWRTHDVIDVNAFLAFDTERVINNPNGSGLPYLAVGTDSESYSVAYRTDAEGNESGEYVMAWRGVKFVDGAPGVTVMQRTDIESEKEGVFAGIGSNISYGGKADFSDKKCGFFGRTNDEPVDAGECVAIAYFTFRGLVTGSLREEREGVYVIRYIDGSFQILGG